MLSLRECWRIPAFAAKVLFATAAVVLSCSLSIAQTTIEIDSGRLNAKYAQQENSQWCWAACVEMVMAYHGASVSQREIVRRSFGVDPDGQLPNFPGSREIISSNLNGWGFDSHGQSYSVASIYEHNRNFIPYLIRDFLEAEESPIIIGYNSGGAVGHAVLLTAIKYVGTPGTPYFAITKITVLDPWPGRGWVTYQGSDLGPRIHSAWIVKASLVD